MTEGASRFLIVRLGSLGDVIHAIPAVAALRRRHATATIDWLVDPRYEGLLKLVTSIDRVIPLDPRESWSGLRRTIRALRKTRYDAAIDLQGLLKSAVLARAAGARRTIGYPRTHLREALSATLYTETADPGPGPHVIHTGLAVMRALDVADMTVEFPLTIPPRVALPSSIAGGGYALVNPGAAWPNKRWPPQRFGQLARTMAERRGLRSLVVWGPGEESIASDVVHASAGAAELAPPTTIIDIVALAKDASLMISGDTGPLHIAAAVGTPIVALFGPTRAERNGPWRSSDISISRLDRCECHYERRCRRRDPCIDDITVDEVAAAVERRVAAR